MRAIFLLLLLGAAGAVRAGVAPGGDTSRVQVQDKPNTVNPSAVNPPPADAPKPGAPTAPAAPLPADLTRRGAPAPQPVAPVNPKDPRTWLWEYRLGGFTEKDYRAAVDALFADYERRLGRSLGPGPKRRVGLKTMTHAVGLSTPLPLVRALIGALEARGFKPAEIFILDQSADRLRAAGFLARVGEPKDEFEGVPVLILDRGKYFDPKWNYESPLPAPDSSHQAQIRAANDWKIRGDDRLSYLPVPLLQDVDFWINLPVGIENPDLGFVGALANASVLASSNTERFMQNPQSGSAAIAEIAAVPELVRGWALNILTLERYQYIGGPLFNSLYCESEATLLFSANPVIIDTLLFERINRAREVNRLPKIDKPAFLEYGEQLDLGDTERGRIYLVRLPK